MVDPGVLQGDLAPSALQRTTFSGATADFVRAWISECKETHFLCQDDFMSVLFPTVEGRARPKRLLDLLAFPGGDKVRLVEADEASDLEYCALSYSWGFSKPYVLTSSNLAAFRKEIITEDLPRLLQDAILVAHGLGIRYLWIDALCIMQDGHKTAIASDDWVDQAGKMNDIFGNAVITIAASECFDGTQRLVLPRNPLGVLPCRLDVDIGLCFEVVPPCTPHCLLHPFDKARYHLDTRAWVFQERILTPRTIHLTRNFLHLECRTELRCEAVNGTEDCHHSGSVAKGDYQVLFSIFGPNGLEESSRDAFLSYWHELVRRYSTTNLSRKSDLLTALAGLTKQIQRYSRLTWAFGLWRECFIQGMLWFVRGGIGSSCHTRAPTWSWASIDIPHGQIIHEPSTHISLLAEILNLPEATDFATQSGTSVDESRHCVRLVGLLRPGCPDSLQEDRGPIWTGEGKIGAHRSCQGMQEIHKQCPFHPDHQLPKDIELHSLLLAILSRSQKTEQSRQTFNTYVGIVLSPVEGHQRRYKRIGYFHIDVQRELKGKVQNSTVLMENFQRTEVEIV